jgi:hypothetical protein
MLNAFATLVGAAPAATFRPLILALESFVKTVNAVRANAFATLASQDPDAKSSHR